MVDTFLLSIIASIIAAVLLSLWPRTRKLIMSTARIITRLIPGLNLLMKYRLSYTRSWELEAIYKEMAQAKRRVYILQTWFPRFKDEYSTWERLLDTIKEQGGHFELRVLLLDPSLYQARLRSRGDLKELKLEGLNMLSPGRIVRIKDFIRKYRDDNIKIDFALINSIPFGPIYCIDDTIHWGLFVSHKDSMSSLHFQTPVKSTVGHVILESFENAWEARSSDLGPSHSATDDAAYKRQVCADFNELRRELEDFKLLGQMKVGNESVGSEVGFAPCLEMCLRKNIRTIVIMRHAATELNGAGIFSGLLTVSLNKTGEEQIRRLLNKFPGLGTDWWDQIYCSTVARTKETLVLLLRFTRDIIPRRELDERNVGELEGQSKRVVEKHPALRNCWKFFFEPNFGESYARLFSRIRKSRFLQELTGMAHRGSQNTLICTHEGPLKIFRMLFEVEGDLAPGDLDIIEGLKIDNCDVYAYVDYGALSRTSSEEEVEGEADKELKDFVDKCVGKSKELTGEWLNVDSGRGT